MPLDVPPGLRRSSPALFILRNSRSPASLLPEAPVIEGGCPFGPTTDLLGARYLSKYCRLGVVRVRESVAIVGALWVVGMGDVTDLMTGGALAGIIVSSSSLGDCVALRS